MKIIQNNYDCKTEEIICEHCNSIFELDENDDDIIVSDDNDNYVYCPCCGQKVYLYEPNTKDNINFPTSYTNFASGVDISNEEINEWIKECIEWLDENPEQPYKYIGTGNTFAVVFNHEDEYTILVTKNYFESYIDK